MKTLSFDEFKKQREESAAQQQKQQQVSAPAAVQQPVSGGSTRYQESMNNSGTLTFDQFRQARESGTSYDDYLTQAGYPTRETYLQSLGPTQQQTESAKRSLVAYDQDGKVSPWQTALNMAQDAKAYNRARSLATGDETEETIALRDERKKLIEERNRTHVSAYDIPAALKRQELQDRIDEIDRQLDERQRSKLPQTAEEASALYGEEMVEVPWMSKLLGRPVFNPAKGAERGADLISFIGNAARMARGNLTSAEHAELMRQQAEAGGRLHEAATSAWEEMRKAPSTLKEKLTSLPESTGDETVDNWHKDTRTNAEAARMIAETYGIPTYALEGSVTRENTDAYTQRYENMEFGEKLGANAGMTAAGYGLDIANAALAGWNTLSGGRLGEEGGKASSIFQAANFLQNAGSGLTAQAYSSMRESANWLEKLILDLEKTGVEQVLDRTLGAGNGLVPMGIRVFGSGAQESEDRGEDWKKQAGTGLARAAIELGTEALSGVGGSWRGTGYGESFLNAVDKWVASKTGSELLGTLANAYGGEALEEMIADILNPLADRIFGIGEATGRGQDRTFMQQLGDFLTDVWGDGQILYDGLLGGLAGIGGGVTAQIGYSAGARNLAVDVATYKAAQRIAGSNSLKAEFEKLTGVKLDADKETATIQLAAYLTNMTESSGGTLDARQAETNLFNGKTTGTEKNSATLAATGGRVSDVQGTISSDFKAAGIELHEDESKVLASGFMTGDTDLDTYEEGILEAYKLGQSGKFTLEEAIRGSKYAAVLNESQFRHAWQLGASVQTTENETADIKTEAGRTRVSAALASLGKYADTAVDAYENGQDVSTYAAAMQKAAVLYAANGADLKAAAQEVREGKRADIIGRLTDKQVDAAAQIGQQMRQESDEAARNVGAVYAAIRQQAAAIGAGAAQNTARISAAIRRANTVGSAAMETFKQQRATLEAMVQANPELEGSEEFNRLFDEAKRNMETVQRMQRAVENLKSKQTKAEEEQRRTTEHKAGTVSYEAESGSVGGVQYEAVDRSKLTQTQQAVTRIAEAIARATGLEIHIAKFGDNVGGEYLRGQGGVIWLNIDANYKGANIAVGSLTHEMTHWLQEYAPEEYQQLKRAVLDEMNRDPARFAQIFGERARIQPDLRPSDITDEMTANACQILFMDEASVQRIVSENRSLGQKILDFFKSILADIKAAFSEIDTSSDFTLYQEVRAAEGAIDQMRDLFAQAMYTATENMQAEKTVQEAEQMTGKNGKASNSAVSEAASVTENTDESSKNTAPEGGVQYQAWDRRDINRAFIDYENTTATNKAVRSKTQSLVSRSKTVSVTDVEIAALVNATNWNDNGEKRRFFKTILRDAVGTDTLFFEFDGATLDAYMTREGRNHAAGGAVTAEKAAIASKIRQLIIDSEYTYSSRHNRHSKSGQKMRGDTEWDYFTAVASTGKKSVPVIFSIRSQNRTERSQIYNMAIKQEEAVSHGAAQNKQSGQPNYGASTSSKNIVTDTAQNSKPQFQFIGERAENADLGALDTAKEMEQNGNDAETIRRETGWFRGMDGKWRFEIDDSNAKYSRRGDLNFRKSNQGYDRFRELTEKAEAYLIGESNKWLTDAEQDELTSLQTEWKNYFKQDGKPRDNSMPRMRLSDYFQHDELFKNYPRMANMLLAWERLPEGIRGQYNPYKNTITLNDTAEMRHVPLDTLIHELQHAIQYAEEFTPGADPAEWEDEIAYVDARIETSQDLLNQALEDIGIKDFVKDSLELVKAGKRTIEEHFEELQRFKDASDQADRIRSFENDLQEQREKRQKLGDADTLYWNTAGEIEARDAASRRGMSAEERKNTPPNLGDEKTVFARRAQFQRWDDTTDDTAAERNGRELAYVRLQSENAILSETVAALRKLTDRQNNTIEKLQKRLQLTKTPEVRENDARKLARQLLQEHSSRVDVGSVAAKLKTVGDYILQTPTAEIDEATLKAKARAAAMEILNNAYDQTSLADETYKQIAGEIKGKKLSIDEDFLGELDEAGGYEKFRKSMFGSFTLAKRESHTAETREGYATVDQFYTDLQSEYGKGFFPDVANEGEQVQILAKMLEAGQPIEVNPYAQYMGEASEELANRIVMDAMSGVLRQNPPTAADKQKARRVELQERILALKAENKLEQREAGRLYQTIYDLSVSLDKAESKYETLRQEANYRTAQVRAEGSARAAEIKASERARAAKQISALKEHYHNMAQRARERREESAGVSKYRKQVEKKARALYEMLLTNSNDKHVPEVLKAPLGEFLESLDFSSKRKLAGGAETQNDMKLGVRLQRLQQMLDNQQKYINGEGDMKEDLGGYIDVAPDVLEYLRSMSEQITETMNAGGVFTINQMNAEDLKGLSKLLSNLTAAIKNMNSFMANARYERVADAARADIQNMNRMGRASAGENGKLFSTAFWENGTPYYIMKRFGEGGRAIFDGLTRGWEKMAFNVQEVIRFADDAYDTKEVNEWKAKTHEITLESGQKITMTTAQIMELSMLLGREQAVKHISKGGIRIGDIETKGGTVHDTTHYHLTAADITAITGMLTERQAAVAKALQRYMAVKGAEWGNEITMRRFGYNFYEEGPDYYPIRTDQNDRPMADTDMQQNSMFRLLNLSSSKALNPKASNALIVGDIFDTFADHMSDMAKLNGMGLSILDAIKWFNYKERINYDDGTYDTVTLQGAMEQAFGTAAQKYFRTLIKDVNGVRESGDRGTAWYNKLMSNYKAAAVAANLRVAFLQPTSYVRASYILKPQHMAGVLPSKAAYREMMKYSGTGNWKDIGGVDTNLARGMREQIEHNSNWKDWLVEKSMVLAELGDQATWSRLWQACKRQTKAENRSLSGEELNRATADLFREVVYATQVMDSTLTRSELMRGSSNATKAMTAFMAEPTLSYNLLMDAASEYRLDVRKNGQRGALGRNRGKLGKAFAVYVCSAAFSAVVESVFDAMRDDDDYESFMLKWSQAMFGEGNLLQGNLLQDLTILGKLPFTKNFISTLQGYTSGDMGLSAFNAAIDAVKIWEETLALNLTYLPEPVQKAANFFGIEALDKPTKTTYYGNMTEWGKIYKTLQALSQLSGIGVSNAARDVIAIFNSTVGAVDPARKIKTYDPGQQKSIKDAFGSGAFSEEEAISKLVETGEAKNADAAYWIVRGWAGEDKYTEIKTAAFAGDGTAFKSEMQQLTAHGVKEKDVYSAIKSTIKKAYLGEDLDESEARIVGDTQLTDEQARRMLKAYAGMSVDDSVKLVADWRSAKTFVQKHGDEYEKYGLSMAQAQFYYSDAKSGSLSIERYAEQVEKYGYDRIKAYYGADGWGSTGLSIEQYDTYATKAAECKGTDNDGDGETDANSVKNQVLLVINALPVSSAVKDAIYRKRGWSERNLTKAPWH